MGRNGYFQLISRNDGTYIKIYPPVNNGVEVKIDEIRQYLSYHNITEYNLLALSNLVKLPNGGETKILSEKILPISEDMNIQVSSDKMKAVVRFYPPSTGGSTMNQEEIIRTLSYQGIKHGIKENQVEKFARDREYCTDYMIAEGTPVQEGTDAEITYYFEENLDARPKLNEDGSVDFHQLNILNEVAEGQRLASLKKEVHGIPGKNVLGYEVPPLKVEVKRLKYGKNITLSEDGLEITSNVNGHVKIDNEGKVVVSNIFEIQGDVDASTGDINYPGDVWVHGNVLTGFSIFANGNVDVDGVVEGARIVAMGQIILKRGIQGMGKGILQCQGNIIAKFIESAAVSANGYIETDCIMHSKISAKGEIHVSGKKGLIVGGHVRSVSLIQAQTIGSPMGSSTIVEVGTDPEIQDKLKKLEDEEKELLKEEQKIKQVIDLMKGKQKKGQLTADQILTFQKSLMNYSEINKKLEEIQGTQEKLNHEIINTKNARVKVTKVIYPGVKVVVSGEFKITTEEAQFCQFLKQNGEVKRLSC